MAERLCDQRVNPHGQRQTNSRLQDTYSSYLMWCRVWDYRTPPSYSEWLKLSQTWTPGAGNVISWKGTQ